MLLVETYLDKSSIHGIGLFAAQDIPKGTLIWLFNQLLDKKYTKDELKCIKGPVCEQIFKYIYLDIISGIYVLCGDDARFFNHSDEPNCLDLYFSDREDGGTFAARNIKIGEELTCDYRTFDVYARRNNENLS